MLLHQKLLAELGVSEKNSGFEDIAIETVLNETQR